MTLAPDDQIMRVREAMIAEPRALTSADTARERTPTSRPSSTTGTRSASWSSMNR